MLLRSVSLLVLCSLVTVRLQDEFIRHTDIVEFFYQWKLSSDFNEKKFNINSIPAYDSNKLDSVGKPNFGTNLLSRSKRNSTGLVKNGVDMPSNITSTVKWNKLLDYKDFKATGNDTNIMDCATNIAKATTSLSVYYEPSNILQCNADSSLAPYMMEIYLDSLIHFMLDSKTSLELEIKSPQLSTLEMLRTDTEPKAAMDPRSFIQNEMPIAPTASETKSIDSLDSSIDSGVKRRRDSTRLAVCSEKDIESAKVIRSKQGRNLYSNADKADKVLSVLTSPCLGLVLDSGNMMTVHSGTGLYSHEMRDVDRLTRFNLIYDTERMENDGVFVFYGTTEEAHPVDYTQEMSYDESHDLVNEAGDARQVAPKEEITVASPVENKEQDFDIGSRKPITVQGDGHSLNGEQLLMTHKEGNFERNGKPSMDHGDGQLDADLLQILLLVLKELLGMMITTYLIKAFSAVDKRHRFYARFLEHIEQYDKAKKLVQIILSVVEFLSLMENAVVYVPIGWVLSICTSVKVKISECVFLFAFPGNQNSHSESESSVNVPVVRKFRNRKSRHR